jgi:hypothetical protein
LPGFLKRDGIGFNRRRAFQFLIARDLQANALRLLFLVGFSALFGWQVGGFLLRNRPRTYSFDRVPEALLPRLRK